MFQCMALTEVQLCNDGIRLLWLETVLKFCLMFTKVWDYGDILLIQDDIKFNVKMTHFSHVMIIKTTQNHTIFVILRQRIVQLVSRNKSSYHCCMVQLSTIVVPWRLCSNLPIMNMCRGF